MSKLKKTKPRRKLGKGSLIIDKSTKYTYEGLTSSQKDVVKLFNSWFFDKKPRKPILRVGGAAGFGKDWVLRYLIQSHGFDQSECYVMAYTGQAVNVMRGYGIYANTIHSMIMIPVDEPMYDKEGEPILRRGVPLTRVTFRPMKSIPKSVKLFVVNEASFLPTDLEDTLLSYGVPIFEIGDPIQLPPVGGEQAFTMENLDYFGEGVMRQSKDSEIIDFATKLRLMENVDTSKYYGEVRFLRQQESIEETFFRFLPFFKSADIILTSTNKQRQAINDLYREFIIKADSPFPRKGERMICRKNNHSMNIGQYILTNGTQGICMADVGRTETDKQTKTYTMDFQPDVTADTGKYFKSMICDTKFLTKPCGFDDPFTYKRPGEKMEFAHAITCHLSQGSSWKTVLYIDSFASDPYYLARLRYTAVTRATDKIIYLLPYTKYPGYCDLSHIEERMRMLQC